MPSICEYFDPCSSKFNCTHDFWRLKCPQQAVIIAICILALAPTVIAGVCPIFRLLVNRFKPNSTHPTSHKTNHYVNNGTHIGRGGQKASDKPSIYSSSSYSLNGANLSHVREELPTGPAIAVRSAQEQESKEADEEDNLLNDPHLEANIAEALSNDPGLKATTDAENECWRLARPPVPRVVCTCDLMTEKLMKFDNADLTRPRIGDAVYIATNEVNLSALRQVFETTQSLKNSCHIGVSSWHNFDIMFARRSSRALLFDINPETALFMNNSLDILRGSTNRDDYIKKMKRFKEQNDALQDRTVKITFSLNISLDPIYEDVDMDEFEIELSRPGSWLATDAGYDYIKSLANKGKIAVISEDIGASDKFQKVRKLLDDNSIQIDTLYVSNIFGCLLQLESQASFSQTIGHLSQNETLVIFSHHCFIRNEEKKTLMQDVRTGKQLKDQGIQTFFTDIKEKSFAVDEIPR